MLFSYLPPQSDAAVHDPGAGAVGSEIQNDNDLFRYSIDTRGMYGGVGWWYFVSEDPNPAKRRAKVGRFTVRDVPRALLERKADSPLYFDNDGEDEDGLSLLGADGTESKMSLGAKSVAIGAGVLVGLFLLS